MSCQVRANGMRGPMSVLLSTALLLSTSACSFASGSRQSIVITASDPEAKLYVDGQYVGTGTASVKLRKKKMHSVIGQIDDRAGTATIDREISTLGMLDLIGGCIIILPWLGVVAPGFWTLQPETVVIAIPPAGSDGEQ